MKEDKLLYSISEVSEELNLTCPTLRFWETEFKQIKPQKNKRGVRYYTKEMVNLISNIAYLTRNEGYTLEGVKKYLDREKFQNIDTKIHTVKTLEEIKQTLLHIKKGLEINNNQK